MVDANHQVIEGKTIEFIIPKLKTTSTSHH
jgi:hypothetical protein